MRVPGAFELPIAARHAAESGEFAAVICLGCLIRGATPHFELIASAVAHGLTAAAGDTGVPITFGVLTTNTVEEALERAGEGPSNKGWEAAAAAVEMAVVVSSLIGREPRCERGGSCRLESDGVKKDRRRRGREAALQILYQWDIGKNDVGRAVETFFDLQWPDPSRRPTTCACSRRSWRRRRSAASTRSTR